MLNPGDRDLYTAAFKPPSGMTFDSVIGACFSLSLEFLLQVPLNLSLIASKQQNGDIDRIPLLKSIRELSDKITIYVQKGQIHVPNRSNMLFGLLDSMIVEAEAPNGGFFHPKFWLLRFHASADADDVLFRLLVLSRNLTQDRSWDVALKLEGKPTGKSKEYNGELHKMVSSLPEFANIDEIGNGIKIKQAQNLAEEVKTVEWVMPKGYHGINFHTIGLSERSWVRSLPPSNKLAVISPFCRSSALEELITKTSEPFALVSRPETLLIEENQAAYQRFGTLWELDEKCEMENGEDNSERPQWDTSGLHAKVYVMEIGRNTHIFLGSANATNAAILNSMNVELMVELVGKRNGKNGIGGIEELFGEHGFGKVLQRFKTQDMEEDASQEEVIRHQQALKHLEEARRQISKSKLEIHCTRIGDTNQYNLQLNGNLEKPIGIASARAWMITAEDGGKEAGSNSIDLFELIDQDSINLGKIDASNVSRLLAIYLRAEAFNTGIQFALNLKVFHLPKNRDTAILQAVVNSPDDFLRYLRLLLETQRITTGNPGQIDSDSVNVWNFFASDGKSLLEHLVKAYCREKGIFDEVLDFVNSLRESNNRNRIFPENFLETWEIFEEALQYEPD